MQKWIKKLYHIAILIYIENRDQIHRNLFCCFLFWYLLVYIGVYIACCNLIMQRNNTIESGSENRSSFLSESSWLLREKNLYLKDDSVRGFRAAPFYTLTHTVAYMGVCCMPVYWCSCCVTCHVIYRFGDGGGG